MTHLAHDAAAALRWVEHPAAGGELARKHPVEHEHGSVRTLDRARAEDDERRSGGCSHAEHQPTSFGRHRAAVDIHERKTHRLRGTRAFGSKARRAIGACRSWRVATSTACTAGSRRIYRRPSRPALREILATRAAVALLQWRAQLTPAARAEAATTSIVAKPPAPITAMPRSPTRDSDPSRPRRSPRRHARRQRGGIEHSRDAASRLRFRGLERGLASQRPLPAIRPAGTTRLRATRSRNASRLRFSVQRVKPTGIVNTSLP